MLSRRDLKLNGERLGEQLGTNESSGPSLMDWGPLDNQSHRPRSAARLRKHERIAHDDDASTFGSRERPAPH
jgi:hypothetical protein